jgi:hypothetical protein
MSKLTEWLQTAPPLSPGTTPPSGSRAPIVGQIPLVASDVVAFVGRCLKGPVNEPVAIGSLGEFRQVFGGLWSHSLLPHAVEQFFEQGGQRAVVVRVVSAAKAPTIDLPAGLHHLMLAGLCPGSREFLRASVDYDGISRQDSDLFNLVVQRVRVRGSELVEDQETYRRVSVLAGSARDISRVLLGSRLVRVVGPIPAQRPAMTHDPLRPAVIGYVDCNHDGDDGLELSDYDVIGSQTNGTGLFALQKGSAFNFLCIPPPTRERDLGMSVLVVATRFCRSQHALLIVDPPRQWTTLQRALEGLADWPFRSADALMFFPPLLCLNPLNGRAEAFAPGAASIGALLRSEEQEQFWNDATDLPGLRPAATPTLWIDELQRARLAQLGVNVVRGTRAPLRDRLALRTLAGELASGSGTRLLAPRRLDLLVSASIERGTRWVVLEGNTARSRERVRRQVEQFLLQLAHAGLLAGTERNLHYYVLCDERLNGSTQQTEASFRLVFGYQSVHSPTRQSRLVEHRHGGSCTRAVSLNQLASLELSVR